MKKSQIIVLAIAGALIGLFITLHFRTPFSTESDFPTQEIEAKDELFKVFADEQSYLQSRIVALRKQIDDAQALIDLTSENSNLTKLNLLKKEIGLTEVSGKGLEIHLDDSPFALREGTNVSDANLVQASDLRDLANVLFSANAEAISINGQRVIAFSPISSVGTTILVNNAYIAPPFIISAVGDEEIMIQRLSNKSLLGSLYERQKKQNLVFYFSIKNNLIIPIFNGNLRTEHINLVGQ